MNDWIDIKEAPKDGTEVLLSYPTRRRPTIGRWNQDEFAKRPKPHWSTVDARWIGTITEKRTLPSHFMPLPPKAEEQND